MMEREAVFRALFQTAYPALRRYAFHRGLRGADADDLVACTLEVAWRRIDDVPRDDPLPWLFAVARNLWRNQCRGDARREVLVTRLAPREHALGPTEISVVDAETIRRAFGHLDEEDQELLRLVAWDGLSPGQTAVVLGCSAVAARSRLHRARNRLAALLEFDPRLQRERHSEQTNNENTPRSTQTEVL